MKRRDAEWYRDWAKAKPPSPWADCVLGVVSIAVLVTMVITILRNV